MSDEEENDLVSALPSDPHDDDSETDLTPQQLIAVQQNQEVLQQILREKKGLPSKFQSHWEKDENDIDLDTEEQIRTIPSKRMLWAAEHNELDVAKELLVQDKELLMSRDQDLYTPLHRASYNGHVDMVKFLLLSGADITATTIDQWQPLHSACRWNNTEVAAILIQHGANVNAQTAGGQTPLHLAAQNNDDCQKILELLLMNSSIDASLKNRQGEMPADVCARSNGYHWLFEVAEPSINELKPKPGTS